MSRSKTSPSTAGRRSVSSLEVPTSVGIPEVKAYPMPGESQLPANTAGWRADPDRAVLLVHDMQRFFLRPFPQDAPPGRELVANAARLRTLCAEMGIPVCYTAQPGSMTPAERGLLLDFWGPGMQADAADRAVVDELAPDADDWLLTKWRYSAFHKTGLLDRMRAGERDQLVICGVYAHVGVLMSACDAFSSDIEVFVVADAVADFTLEHHRMALTYAAQRCAVVATTDHLLAQLTKRARGTNHGGMDHGFR
ncbi:MAG: trans-2,3-dihydro-3-hydroxyanthranilic acid synthase [Solirubrobacteraceae bacterium]|nr:trans-2,3-dihydro-3-hydroxyanthranilic acid synthase [Solirubrobacteraceae bacterium]